LLFTPLTYNHTTTADSAPLPLHDALPIGLLRTDLNTLLSFQEDLSDVEIETFVDHLDQMVQEQGYQAAFQAAWDKVQEYPTCEADRKSTRLNSSHVSISYAVFCLIANITN